MSSQPTELTENKHPAEVKLSAFRPFVFTLLILLSFYYLWVLYLAAHPNVSTAYRTYYIEKKTRYWGRENTELIWPESGVVEVKQTSPFLSRQGWAPKPGRDGRKLVHNASLYFNFDKPLQHPVRVKLTLSQSITEPVYVSVNGGRKIMLMPLEVNSLETNLPASAFMQQRSIQQVDFETDASLRVDQVVIAEVVQ
ncbi:hypothetical protein [Vibrio sp. 10N]|uniref:hypothetical protein n=1 Tax=Vibrio sp. 10N TaxID=3058938 RepID=UPI0030C739DA